MEKLILNITDYPDIPNTKLIYFEGDFDGYAEDVVAKLQAEVDQAGPNSILIFDFNKLNYLNSYAIGQLVSWHTTMNKKQGRIMIVGINKNIEDIFSVLGIGSVFKTYASLDELKKSEF